MSEHTRTHLQTPGSEDEILGHPTMQASPQTSRNARKGERRLEEVMEERDDGYRLLLWDALQQQGLVNLTNTPFSRVAKALMGHGDLGDEMNLSLIHSLACAKYSIIKVTHILYDPTFPDIFSFERSHTVSVTFFFFPIWIFFLLKHRNLSFPEWPSPKVPDNLSEKRVCSPQICRPAPWSQAAGGHFFGCLLESQAWPQSW